MKVTCGLIDGDYNMHAEVGTYLTFEHIDTVTRLVELSADLSVSLASWVAKPEFLKRPRQT